MKVLVTGGAGFIGSNFVIRSLETRENIAITVLDSLTYAGTLSNLQPRLGEVEFIEGDVRNSNLVDSLVPEFDVVFHFAAESHNDNSLVGPKVFYETNLMGTLAIANACVAHDVRLHHVSTDEVFGDLPIDSLQEFDISTPYNPSSPYSASKAASDQLVRAWVRSFGLKATISNCSNNYGPRQHWEKLIPATISRIISGDRPVLYGNGENVRDWIHVDDHTDGIWAILDRGSMGETYLLGARNQVSNVDLVRSILSAMHMPSDHINFVSDRPGHDRKYAINPQSSFEIGWSPKHRDIVLEIPALIDFYRERLALESGLN